jgi:uncharacterized protein (DUF697 family)
MADQELHKQEDEAIEAEVSSGLDEAQQFAKSLDFNEAKSGEWFIRLLQKVAFTYDRNVRAQYFQQKYPGLPPDEIADILTSVTVRYAAIAGAVAGATATANQVAGVASAGMTAPLFLGTIGAEMIYLARIQMRLVLDLSVVYDLQLDPEDPEDVLMVFGYALGVAPTQSLGKVAQTAARAGATGAVKKYVSKGTLKAVQAFGRRLGFKILQRTILKYAVPVASAAVGSSYNYATTKSVGKIAKAHFKNRGKATEELRTLVSRQRYLRLLRTLVSRQRYLRLGVPRRCYVPSSSRRRAFRERKGTLSNHAFADVVRRAYPGRVSEADSWRGKHPRRSSSDRRYRSTTQLDRCTGVDGNLRR